MTPLQLLQERAIHAAQEAGEEMFMGIPDAWFEPHPNYGCPNGHVSRMYIKSETRGNLCPACQEPLAIIPHGYTDTTLRAALAAIQLQTLTKEHAMSHLLDVVAVVPDGTGMPILLPNGELNPAFVHAMYRAVDAAAMAPIEPPGDTAQT